MKRFTFLLLVSTLLFVSPFNSISAQPSKMEKRIAYTLKNLKISSEQQAKLKPLLVSYLTDMKAAKKKHKDLENKYAAAIEKQTINDTQAKAILDAKFECDGKELGVKKTYYPKFLSVIPAKKVLLCFDLLNDKMSKIEGTKKGSNSKDDD